MRAKIATRPRTIWNRTLGVVAGAGLAFACSSAGESSGPDPLPPAGGPFESDKPVGSIANENDGAETPSGTGGSSATGGNGGGAAVDSGDGDGGGERAIAEADVVALEGGKLYALSRYSGLSVIDVSVQDRLER